MWKIFILTFFLSGFIEHSRASSIGDGSDGSPSISGIVNSYTAVSQITAISCGTQITVGSSASFQADDLVLIIQMEGATIDNTNTSTYGTITDVGTAGVYEFTKVSSVSGNTITTGVLQNSYDVNQKVQLINVPQYQNPTIIGTLTCQAWDGATGGILAIDATGTITFESDVDVSAKGFRGGVPANATPYFVHLIDYVGTYDPSKYSAKGEGIAGYGVGTQLYGRGAPANGAGGGNNVNAGGGGGSNYGCGGLGGWGYDNPVWGSNIMDPQGIGGYALPYNNGNNIIFMGGGGGSGHENDNAATAGGNGGGIVIISCSSIDGGSHNAIADGETLLIPGLTVRAGEAVRALFFFILIPTFQI